MMTHAQAAQELREWEQMNPNAHPADRARVAGALFACVDVPGIKAPRALSADEQLTEWKIGGAL